jgi:predicted nucleic acid-binding protein
VSGAAVLDASVALAWLLPGEATSEALALRQRAVEQAELSLLVPSLVWYEVGNVLWRAVRQRRMPEGMAMTGLRALRRFAIETRHIEVEACLQLALTYGLSVYDASYLVLAIGVGGPLWTLDHALAEAARARGVLVEP